VTGDWGKRPERIAALTENGERHWVSLLIGEINREMYLGLDSNISFARTLAAVRKVGTDVGPIAAVTVGASNAARTASALKRKGIKADSRAKAGWRVTEDAVAYMTAELSQSVAEDDVVVLHCLDGSCFYVLERSGAMSMPSKGGDGVVHIFGKVVVAKGLQLDNLLELLGPIFREREGKLTILVCPSVRFVEACCKAHDTLSPEERKAEAERQLKELGSLRRELRSWLVKRGLHDVLLADPLEAAGAARSAQAARELMCDSVHMKPAGYASLAGRIKELIQQWRLEKKRKGSSSEQPAGKRFRLDLPQPGSQAQCGGGRSWPHQALGGQKKGQGKKSGAGK
jgi:hypothetical protein